MNLEYEQEGDGSLVGSLQQIEDIIVSGGTLEDLIEDAAEQLMEYAEDYCIYFDECRNAPNRRPHFPFILNVLRKRVRKV